MKHWVTLVVLLAAMVTAPALLAATDEEQIDEVISQFWQNYQMGDYDSMGKYMADDVTVISGSYGPPLEGWTAVRQAYESQRGVLQNISVTRQSTRITVRGKCAWATQQWIFTALANRQPVNTAGHTTLIFEKRGGRWLIVLNHSSVVVLQPQPAKSQTPSPGPPGK